jgi:flagellar hook-basal body protein
MSFYTSLTGLNAATAQLAVTSNNIANVGTTGFKRSRADFGDIFATSPLQKASSVVGQGVALKAVTQEFSQGNVQFSASSLDIAITGDGFFPLKSADGLQDIYTRNGTFTLNDSFAVVNSAGQALMAATVDSSGKADLENLRKLYIPRATAGEARQTENVQLALNLPADSPVVTKAFDPADPTTYNLTTAVTVFDSGGNDYLATVYYVKTQVASPDDPNNKWQTHVYIGDNKLRENLIQSTDSKGKAQYVNKYGEIRSESSVPPVPVEKIARGVSRLYNLDNLRSTNPSVPAGTQSFPALTDQLVADWKSGISGSAVSLPDRVVDLAGLKSAGQPTADKYSITVGSASYEISKSSFGGDWSDANDTGWDFVGAKLAAAIGTGATYDKTSGALKLAMSRTDSLSQDIVLKEGAAADGTALKKSLGGLKFTINIDGSERTVDATSMMFGDTVRDKKFTGVDIARSLSNELNKNFGGQRYFDFSSLVNPSTGKAQLFKVAVAEANSKDPVPDSHYVSIQIDASGTGQGVLSKMTIAETEAKIKAQLATQETALRAKANLISDAAEKAEMLASADRLATLSVRYDPVERGFKFTAGDGEKVFVGSASNGPNELFGLVSSPTEVNLETGFYGVDMPPNGLSVVDEDSQRYGIKVEFDDFNKAFTVSSGSTGDTSSISIKDGSDLMSTLFRFPSVGSAEISTGQSERPLRGIASQPAVLSGSPIGLNVSGKFAVDSTNNKFVMTVDNVSGVVEMPIKSDYTIDSFRTELERRINSLADSQGRTVSGVKVSVERNALGQSFFKLTTGTTGDSSFLKVSANSLWGLSGDESARGATSKWLNPPQADEIGEDGSTRPLYVDRDGNETTSSDGFDETEALDLWAPIFLDRGELTFDTAGNLISPSSAIKFKPETIGDTGATLSFSINYESSTQYTNPFSVLAQSQDGSPEGDLIGLDIGDGGLVSANYSNGTQKNLAKIVLSNFSAPTGLRQVGEASYLATSQSGRVTVGEPGTAGFGTIRAGARERANVDLTQELIELISSQRNFQANAKAIETNNTLTQSIINIRS